jgi:histidyl-tRNA synthetase
MSPVVDRVLGKSQNTVLAGGRYDDLSLQYINKSVPSIGWAAGVDRLVLLLQALEIPIQKNSKKRVVVVSFLQKEEQAEYGQRLRKTCLKV